MFEVIEKRFLELVNAMGLGSEHRREDTGAKEEDGDDRKLCEQRTVRIWDVTECPCEDFQGGQPDRAHRIEQRGELSRETRNLIVLGAGI